VSVCGKTPALRCSPTCIKCRQHRPRTPTAKTAGSPWHARLRCCGARHGLAMPSQVCLAGKRVRGSECGTIFGFVNVVGSPDCPGKMLCRPRSSKTTASAEPKPAHGTTRTGRTHPGIRVKPRRRNHGRHHGRNPLGRTEGARPAGLVPGRACLRRRLPDRAHSAHTARPRGAGLDFGDARQCPDRSRPYAHHARGAALLRLSSVDVVAVRGADPVLWRHDPDPGGPDQPEGARDRSLGLVHRSRHRRG